MGFKRWDLGKAKGGFLFRPVLCDPRHKKPKGGLSFKVTTAFLEVTVNTLLFLYGVQDFVYRFLPV